MDRFGNAIDGFVRAMETAAETLTATIDDPSRVSHLIFGEGAP